MTRRCRIVWPAFFLASVGLTNTFPGGWAKIRFDNTGVEIINQKGTFFVAGTTSDPGSGSCRLWVDTVQQALVVSNNAGATLTFTIQFVG